MMRRINPVVAPMVVVASASVVGSSDAAPNAGAPAPASGLPSEGFALLGEEKGIQIYRREKRAGVELGGVGDIAGPPERVRRVLLDYVSHPRWNKHLKESRVLARGENFIDVYQRLNLPILDDRDYTLHVVWGNEGDVLWMRFTTANERGPAPVKGVVRVTQHEGAWRFEPANGGQSTHAVYRFHLDLAGSFPAWMGRGQATSGVADLFGNIAKQLPNYR